MSAKVILNPYSARWKARRRRPEVEDALRGAGVEYELVETSGPGHGEELARQAALAGYRPIIVARGDGAIGEGLNGLYRANPRGAPGPLRPSSPVARRTISPTPLPPRSIPPPPRVRSPAAGRGASTSEW